MQMLGAIVPIERMLSGKAVKRLGFYRSGQKVVQREEGTNLDKALNFK